jgi:shikimate kinase
VEERVMRHVLIVGLPGAGKSKLLEICRVNFPHILSFDLDRELELKMGLPQYGLTQWILSRPEGMDRNLEHNLLVDLLKYNATTACVVSLGGGALDLFIEQKRSLSDLGQVSWIYLESDLAVILDQLMQDSSRPHARLGNREYWQAKFKKRIEFFSQLPNVYRCQLHNFDPLQLVQMLHCEK